MLKPAVKQHLGAGEHACPAAGHCWSAASTPWPCSLTAASLKELLAVELRWAQSCNNKLVSHLLPCLLLPAVLHSAFLSLPRHFAKQIQLNGLTSKYWKRPIYFAGEVSLWASESAQQWKTREVGTSLSLWWVWLFLLLGAMCWVCCLWAAAIGIVTCGVGRGSANRVTNECLCTSCLLFVLFPVKLGLSIPGNTNSFLVLALHAWLARWVHISVYGDETWRKVGTLTTPTVILKHHHTVLWKMLWFITAVSTLLQSHCQSSELLRHLSLSSFPCLTLLFPKSHVSSLLMYTLAAFDPWSFYTLQTSVPAHSAVQYDSAQCRGHSQGKERMAPHCTTCKKLKNVLSKFGSRSSRYGPQKKHKKGTVAYECMHIHWLIFMVNRVNGTKPNVCPRKAWECLLITYQSCFSIAAVNELSCNLETSIPGTCLPLPLGNRHKALKELWSLHRHPCGCKLH